MKIFNKTAPQKFKIEEKFEAGIELLGSEVKAIRLGHADLSGSYVKLMSGQAYLINTKIFPYKFSRIENYQEDRTRRLLLHKKELLSLKVQCKATVKVHGVFPSSRGYTASSQLAEPPIIITTIGRDVSQCRFNFCAFINRQL